MRKKLRRNSVKFKSFCERENYRRKKVERKRGGGGREGRGREEGRAREG